MSDFDKLLSDFSENDSVIKFGGKHAPNNVFEGKLIDCIVEPDPFSVADKKTGRVPDRLVVRFMCNDEEERYISSKSKRFSTALRKAGVRKGDTLRITCFGEGFSRNFNIEVFGRPSESEAIPTVEPDDVPF